MSKVRDQLRALQANAEVGNHRLFGHIAMALTRELQARTGQPIPVILSGKKEQQHKIAASLAGTIVFDDPAKRDAAGDEIQRLMDEIKNPARFMAIVEKR